MRPALFGLLFLSMVLTPAVSEARVRVEFRFHGPHDHDRWHRGYWHHGWHGGHYGWYWVVAGSWYAFSHPVYPYPSADVPPVIVQPQVTVVNPPPPATAPAGYSLPPPPPSPSANLSSPFWYFCKSTNSYYPYVTTCAEGWAQVSATPAAQ